MRLAPLLYAVVAAVVAIAPGASNLARAQEIRLYSEFERFDPYGSVVAPDRDSDPRENPSRPWPATAISLYMS